MTEVKLPQFLQFLLEPVSEHVPCGENLEYAPHYMEFFIRIKPKGREIVGVSTGNKRLESEFEPVRWSDVERECLQILQNTRDLRLCTILVRCRAQQVKAEGLRQGLYIIERLLALWPEELFPLMESDGQPDVLPRADALLSLVENKGLLADIRSLTISGVGGLRLEVRDVERSFLLPLAADALPPEAMQHRLEELHAQNPPDYAALIDSLNLARSIDQWSQSRMGAESPNLMPLIALLERLEPHRTTGAVPPPAVAQHSLPLDEPVPHCSQTPDFLATQHCPDTMPIPPAGGIANRHVAKERLRDVRLWFEEHEPSSPVPVLLRQAEQLIGKRFSAIVHCLPDELLEKWENE